MKDNVWNLYHTIKLFQTEQQEAYSRYIKRIEALEQYKGSEYYQQESKRAMVERRATEDAARRIARDSCQKWLDAMREAARARKALAPTQEQINLLSALKLRDSVSTDELETIARAMDGNSMGLSIIQEYARAQAKKRAEKSGLHSDVEIGVPDFSKYKTGPLTGTDAEDFLKNLAVSCREIINSDGASRVRGFVADLHERTHGVPAIRDSLPREPVYESEEQFYTDVSLVPFATVRESFNENE